mgnify:CR=1 FL=1
MTAQPDKIRPAMFGGLTIALISTIPILNFINCFCCAGVILGGFVSVYFFNKALEDESIRLSLNDGFSLGVMSGALGALISMILKTAIGANLKQQIEKILHSPAQLPEELEEMLIQLAENMSDFVLLTIDLGLSLVINIIFASLGAIIAVSYFNKKRGH